MPQVRRPSLSLGGTRGRDDQDYHQTQRAIQNFRLSTQEALAESRDEIMRLEEEKEIKQMRLEELAKEIEELQQEDEFGKMASLKNLNDGNKPLNRGRAQRRWSIGLNTNNNNKINEGAEETNDTVERRRRSKSVDDDDFFDSDNSDNDHEASNTNRRWSIMPKRDNNNTHKDPAGILATILQSKRQKEELLMEKLHEVQEENKKIIEKHEENLEFKQQQVSALEMALEEQGHIMKNLEQDLYQLQQESRTVKDDNVNSMDDQQSKDAANRQLADLKDELQKVNSRENEFNTKIRAMKRIIGMDAAERKETMSELKKDIIGSAVRLQAAKRSSRATEDTVRAAYHAHKTEWAQAGIKLALMKRVSMKQISRMLKKARKGEKDSLFEILDRASQAVDEELKIRSDVDVSIIAREAVTVEKLISAMVDCTKSYIVGLEMLFDKELGEDECDAISDHVGNMEKCLEFIQDGLTSAIGLIEEVAKGYAQDEALLPPSLLEDFKDETSTAITTSNAEQSNPGEGTSNDGDDETMADESAILDDESIMTNLQRRNKELDHKFVDVNEQLGVVERERKDWVAKYEDLKEKFLKANSEWEDKDEEIERLFDEAEDMRIEEDRIRDFLEHNL